ncbi:hypothetical protein C1H46_045188 [Malus baccata]|uniref:Uncharacterized protein n=1 Tax=Malus baccata TaxID=106549 RepID=A0A540K4Y2_MALBA|nr:hypothetical protein C1H46_045188 [Malus baccata]
MRRSCDGSSGHGCSGDGLDGGKVERGAPMWRRRLRHRNRSRDRWLRGPISRQGCDCGFATLFEEGEEAAIASRLCWRQALQAIFWNLRIRLEGVRRGSFPV